MFFQKRKFKNDDLLSDNILFNLMCMSCFSVFIAVLWILTYVSISINFNQCHFKNIAWFCIWCHEGFPKSRIDNLQPVICSTYIVLGVEKVTCLLSRLKQLQNWIKYWVKSPVWHLEHKLPPPPPIIFFYFSFFSCFYT